MRSIRPLVFLLSLLGIAYQASAQTVTATPGTTSETEMFRWAVTQGGLVVVVLVVVWSYRRDFQRIFAAEQSRTQELIIALQASTTAITMQAETTREQAHADRESAKQFMELASSIKACEAIRDTLVASTGFVERRHHYNVKE